MTGLGQIDFVVKLYRAFHQNSAKKNIDNRVSAFNPVTQFKVSKTRFIVNSYSYFASSNVNPFQL